MPQISIELNKNLTAIIHYYHLRPYILDYYDYDGSKYRVLHADGSFEYFKSHEEAIEYLKNEIKSGAVAAKARLSKVVFLQRKYKKQAFELIAGEMQAIKNTIAEIPAISFSDANLLFEFCIPDPAY